MEFETPIRRSTFIVQATSARGPGHRYMTLGSYSLIPLAFIRSPYSALYYLLTTQLNRDMPRTSLNAQSPSILRRIWDAILTLFCQPTRPPSPPLATMDFPPGTETQPSSPLESALSMFLVEDALVAKSGVQEHPANPSAQSSSAESLTCSYPELLEDFAISAQGAATVLGTSLISSTTTIHFEGPVAALPLTSSTPQPSPTLAPADNVSADDDMECHPELTHALDTSPDDLHNDPPASTQEFHAELSSATPDALSPPAFATPIVPAAGAFDLPPSVAAQEYVHELPIINHS